YNNLEEVTVDTNELENLLGTHEEMLLDSGEEDFVDSIKEKLKNKNVGENEIDDLINKINGKVAKIQKEKEKESKVSTLQKDVEGYYNEDNFTESSWNEYIEAVELAESVINNTDEYTQEDIEEAIELVKEAENNLEEKEEEKETEETDVEKEPKVKTASEEQTDKEVEENEQTEEESDDDESSEETEENNVEEEEQEPEPEPELNIDKSALNSLEENFYGAEGNLDNH